MVKRILPKVSQLKVSSQAVSVPRIHKDGKKKRHSAQDTGSESGKSSPLFGVHQVADGYTVTVNPAHTGQEEFHII